MERPPRPLRDPVVSRSHGLFILLRGSLVAAAAGAGFVLAGGASGANVPEARTVAFCVAAYSQVLYAFAFRSERETLFRRGLLSNRALLAAVVVASLLQLAVVALPAARPLFDTVPLTGTQWVGIGLLALAPVTAVELGKLVRGAFRREPPAVARAR
jgi:Ca2+-transporting ATPase